MADGKGEHYTDPGDPGEGQEHMNFNDETHLLTAEEAEAYLTSLPGVGIKTAKCVLMYSLGREVLPVDTHVLRVATRLDLVNPDTTRSQAHRLLEAEIPPKDRYAFHVNALAHGRAVCKAREPDCPSCPLKAECPLGLKD